MRVCFVTNFIPPYRKTFFEKLCANPRDQWLILRGRVGQETGRPDYKGKIAAPTREVENVERPLGPFTLRFQRGALAAVQPHKPDVLVLLGMAGNISNWLLLLWARITGKRVVIWACGWEPQKAGSLSLWLKQRLMSTYFGLADKCLLYSTKGMNYLASTGVSRQKMEVCFNGIEIDELLVNEQKIIDEAAAIRTRESNTGDFVFIYVGGLLEEKRVDLLLDAFASIHNENPATRLWIVGDGPDAPRLKAYAAQQELSGVTFFGRIIDGVDAYFSAADVFVLPGLGGLAFNQAMFWRTPCIGTEADGTEDDLVIDGETGFRFELDQLESLRSVMHKAANLSASQLAVMGEKARAVIVDRSNVDQMVATFHRTLDAL
jgi:glycosyltransferase involved in cell wall biosynthesis